MTSTGGGHYTLPVSPDETRLVLHTYLDQWPDSGMSYPADTRWVGFAKEEE